MCVCTQREASLNEKRREGACITMIILIHCVTMWKRLEREGFKGDHVCEMTQVPTGVEKKGLLEKVDEVPTRVQQLQFTVKNPTVGKAATFTKVDSVIQETKNLMNVISKVVTTCFECASKVSSYNFVPRKNKLSCSFLYFFPSHNTGFRIMYRSFRHGVYQLRTCCVVYVCSHVMSGSWWWW